MSETKNNVYYSCPYCKEKLPSVVIKKRKEGKIICPSCSVTIKVKAPSKNDKPIKVKAPTKNDKQLKQLSDKELEALLPKLNSRQRAIIIKELSKRYEKYYISLVGYENTKNATDKSVEYKNTSNSCSKFCQFNDSVIFLKNRTKKKIEIPYLKWVKNMSGNCCKNTKNITEKFGGLKRFGFKTFSIVYVLGMIYGCALLAITNLPEIDIAVWIGGSIGLIFGVLSVTLAYKIMKFVLIVGMICGAVYAVYSVI